MKWHLLIERLVSDAGGSLPVAKSMGKPSFQGTLHKIAAGLVKSPSRSSAERIAKHFKIPIDALYHDHVATEVFERRYGEDEPARNDPLEYVPAFSLSTPPLVKESPPEYDAGSDDVTKCLVTLDELVSKLHPNLVEAGRLALARWAEGKSSHFDAAETLSGLVAASKEMTLQSTAKGSVIHKRTGT